MARSRTIYRDGKPIARYENNELIWAEQITEKSQTAPYIIPDITPVQSSIDGSVISSRTQMREYCKKHGVVPTEELKGLPTKTFHQPLVHSKQERQQIKEFMSHLYDKHGLRPT